MVTVLVIVIVFVAAFAIACFECAVIVLVKLMVSMLLHGVCSANAE